MRISSKCSIALHILIVITVLKDRKFTSELLGKSTGCNPAMIRNLLGKLKKAGLVTIQRGTGGANLALDPSKITILDVYNAVDDSPTSDIIALHPNPTKYCPVGRVIYSLLDEPYKKIIDSMKEEMSQHTLEKLIAKYKVKIS